MTKPLLIEIAAEELPAIPFLKELPNIQTKWKKILEENNLLCEFDFYYTPRRLVFWHREFKIAQDDTVVEQLGAPLKIAYKDDKPTGAAHGFAKKCGVNIQELGQNIKNGNEVLYYKKEINLRKSTFNSESLIKIIHIKDNKTLLQKQQNLLKNGKILIGAIRPPTVKSPIFRVILRTNINIDIISKTIKYLEEEC